SIRVPPCSRDERAPARSAAVRADRRFGRQCAVPDMESRTESRFWIGRVIPHSRRQRNRDFREGELYLLARPEPCEHLGQLVRADVEVLADAAPKHRGRNGMVAPLLLRLVQHVEDDALLARQPVASVGQCVGYVVQLVAARGARMTAAARSHRGFSPCRPVYDGERARTSRGPPASPRASVHACVARARRALYAAQKQNPGSLEMTPLRNRIAPCRLLLV